MMQRSLRGRPVAWVVGLGLLILFGCGKDENESGATSGGGVGANTPLLWNDTSGTGTGPSGDTALLWNDPNTASFVMGLLDPTDIRTYTYPDIYILGNRHPLMTEVNAREFPVIITQENFVRDQIFEWRISEYERLIGIRRTQPGFPRQAFVTEYGDLRRNARAHCKHYALYSRLAGDPDPNGVRPHVVTPPNVFPLVNHEGDDVLLPGSPPPPVTHVQVQPDNTTVSLRDPRGRLIKSFIDVQNMAGQLVVAGPNYGVAANVVEYWTTNFGPFLLRPDWTHMGVGFWAGEGSPGIFYWNLVAAQNPRALFTGPDVNIILF